MIGLQKLDQNRRFFVVCLLGIKVDLYKCHYKLEIFSSYALTLTIVCMIVVRNRKFFGILSSEVRGGLYKLLL